MERVTVAELKAKLSEHLRRVEAGETIIVVRHGTPVAVLSPFDENADELDVIEPTGDPAEWAQVGLPPLALGADAVELLLADRRRRDQALDDLVDLGGPAE
jgi:prevent-host-death family protein